MSAKKNPGRIAAFLQKHRRWYQGFAMGLMLTAVAIAVLGFAHRFAVLPPDQQRCFVDVMSAQWPRWIGCAMARHEGLAGGLIGAAGAAVAIFVAWLGVKDQIRMAWLIREEDRIERDLPGLRAAYQLVETIFTELKEQGPSNPQSLEHVLDRYKANNVEDAIAYLDHKLPTTDLYWRRGFATTLATLRHRAYFTYASGVIARIPQHLQESAYAAQKAQLQGQIGLIEAELSKLAEKISDMENRAPLLAKARKQFFTD